MAATAPVRWLLATASVRWLPWCAVSLCDKVFFVLLMSVCLSVCLCVCNFWIDVKLLSFSFFCPLPFLSCRGLRVPWCASSNKDRTNADVISVPGQHWRTCTCIFLTLLVYMSKTPVIFFLTCFIYSYCCWFICQWLLWFILTWQGAKPRTPINNQINNLINNLMNNLIACFRTQFLTDLFKDPFLSSVIPMVTPTRCHRANGGNPFVGDCGLTWLPNSHILTW